MDLESNLAPHHQRELGKGRGEIPAFGMMTIDTATLRSAIDVAAAVSSALRAHPPVKLCRRNVHTA